MISIIAFFIGAALGWLRATKRGGTRLDQFQYAAAHGLIFTIVAIVLSVLSHRIGLI